MNHIQWTMPTPPKGLVWVLRIDSLDDKLTLWLYKSSRLTGRSSGWSVTCSSVHIPGRPSYDYLSVEKSSIDQIAEAVIMTADKMIEMFDDEERRLPTLATKAAILAKRLGIKVEVKR